MCINERILSCKYASKGKPPSRPTCTSSNPTLAWDSSLLGNLSWTPLSHRKGLLMSIWLQLIWTFIIMSWSTTSCGIARATTSYDTFTNTSRATTSWHPQWIQPHVGSQGLQPHVRLLHHIKGYSLMTSTRAAASSGSLIITSRDTTSLCPQGIQPQLDHTTQSINKCT